MIWTFTLKGKEDKETKGAYYTYMCWVRGFAKAEERLVRSGLLEDWDRFCVFNFTILRFIRCILSPFDHLDDWRGTINLWRKGFEGER